MEKTKIKDITTNRVSVPIRHEGIQITEESLRREEETRKLIQDYVKRNLKEGIDFYTIQFGGRESKPSLSKAGAEKFISLLHLRAEFIKDDETWEMIGRPNGVICYLCQLYTKSNILMGEGRGARDIKKDGGDVNKAIKMAEKSALIDAILRTAGLSEVFTQDLEDSLPSINSETEKKPEVVKMTQSSEETMKIGIFQLLKTLKNKKPESAGEATRWVLELTDLELKIENYLEIISRLQVVLKQRNEK